MSSFSEDDSLGNMSLPPAIPVFLDEDSDSSDERLEIQKARAAAAAQNNQQQKQEIIKESDDSDDDGEEDEDEEQIPPEMIDNCDDDGILSMNISESSEKAEEIFNGGGDNDNDDEFNMELPEAYITKKSPPLDIPKGNRELISKADNSNGVIDYSGLFDISDISSEKEFDSPPKKGLKIRDLKRKRKKRDQINKGYKEIKSQDNNDNLTANQGISNLMEDYAKPENDGKRLYEHRKEELKTDDNERQKSAKKNRTLSKKASTDDFPLALLDMISTRRLPVKEAERKETTKKVPRKKKSTKRSKNKRKSQRATKIPPKKIKKTDGVALSIATKRMPRDLVDNNGAISTLRAAEALEAAINLHEKKGKEKKGKEKKGRVIVNRRRKAITDAPEIVRRFGDIARMMVVIHVWMGKKEKPLNEDNEIISAIIDGANIFMKMAKDLGDTIALLCDEFFQLNNNSAMKDVLKGLRENTDEIHQRPTVRKVPSEKAIDAWSGDELNEKSIKEKASLIFRPLHENDASPCTIVLPKDVPAFLTVLHGAFHLEKYVQNYIKNALKEVGDLSPKLSWKEIWEKCAGKNLSKKATFTWPKGTKSKDSNPFTNVVVTAREFIVILLFIKEELEGVICKLKEGEKEELK